MICNLQTEALPSKKWKGVIEIIALITKPIQFPWFQDTWLEEKSLIKCLWKESLKPMENEVGSIFLVENGVKVSPSFVSMVIPPLSMPASDYSQIFIKHISRS